MSATQKTTIAVERRTRDRLDELKPYNSLSFNEFLHELADVYENQQHG